MERFFSALLFLFYFIAYAQTPFDKYLPSDWKIRKVSIESKENTERISKNTGCKVSSIENYFSYEPQVDCRIKVYKAIDAKEARKLYNCFYDTGLKRDGEFLLTNDIVYQFIGDQGILYKCRSLFREQKEIKIWNVEMNLVPIRIADDSDTIKLLRALYKYEIKNHDPASITEIRKLRSSFVFGSELSLSNKIIDGIKPEYVFDTTYTEKIKNDVIIFTYSDIKSELDIPKIKVKAIIPVKEFSEYVTESKIDRSGLTFPNDYWPSDDPKVLSLAKDITIDCSNEFDKLTAIHKWVRSQIQFNGDETGPRYGTLNVIDKRAGNFWDSADVLITLCRSMDLPAREIAGWVAGTSNNNHNKVTVEGDSIGQYIDYSAANDHIWTEVYINGTGWIQVDPVSPFTGVSYNYIPFCIIEDGRMPATYWNIPAISEKK
ncbi:MAG TPA: transglutaminase-like domain-containing protein [Clostridiales bacterium]|nr:transglutaminase-like domain-containing protein [Clostridiales bacterium]HQP70789.1 transglutaminase-like domain-containing protein [Clostridiales bacterium]